MNSEQNAAFEALEEETRRLQKAVERLMLASGDMPPETDVLREVALTLTAAANIIRTTVRAAKMRAEVCEPLCPFTSGKHNKPLPTA